jgi:hypothetical protein
VNARAIAIACASLALGCVHARHVTNEHVSVLDARHVVVGKTTAREVLDRFGPPAAGGTLELLRPADARVLTGTAATYRYVAREIRCVSFLLTGFSDNIPVMPQFPFAWCDDQAASALVIEFDPAGVAKRVTRGRTEVKWRPWQGTAERNVEVETTAQAGVSLR